MIWKKLEEITEKEDKCRINFAQSASSFYNEEISNVWLLYINNPLVKEPGINIYVRNATSNSEHIYNNLVDKYNLQDSQNIGIYKSWKALEIKSKLFREVGEDKFNEIVQYCLDSVLTSK